MTKRRKSGELPRVDWVDGQLDLDGHPAVPPGTTPGLDAEPDSALIGAATLMDAYRIGRATAAEETRRELLPVTDPDAKVDYGRPATADERLAMVDAVLETWAGGPMHPKAAQLWAAVKAAADGRLR